MSLSGRVRRGAALQLGARLFSSTVSFVVTAVVLARVLPEAEYGRFNFYLTLFLLAMSLVDFGANRAAIRMVAAGEADRAAVIRVVIAFKSRVGALAAAAIAAIAWCSEGGADFGLLALASAHALSHGWSGASVGFEVDLDYRVPAASVVLGYALFLALGGALAVRGVASAPPYLVAYGAGIAAQNLAQRVAAARAGSVAPVLDRALLRRVVREAVPLGLSALGVAIYYYADTILLRYLRSEEDVARYSVAYRLMTFGLMVPVLLSQVLYPVFTRCHKKGAAVLQRAVQRSTFHLALLAAIGAGTLWGLAPELLELVFGATYRDSAPALRVLAAALFVVYLTYPHTTALIAAGHAGAFTRITLVSALLNVLLNLAVLPRFGPTGAAATTLATELFVLGAGALALWRRLGVTGASRLLLAPFLLGGGLVLGYAAWPDAWSPWLALALGLAVSAAAAAAMGALPFHLGVEEEDVA